MVKKKICMLGSFAVGKTSLVRKYVHSIFSDKYHTTIGVKVDQKQLQVDGTEVRLILWDIHGEDEYQKIHTSYLIGSSAYFLVMDGTRRHTLETCINLHELARDTIGDVPFIVLINKHDLENEWEIEEEDLKSLDKLGAKFIYTSAKSGANVEEAFHQLAKLTLQDH